MPDLNLTPVWRPTAVPGTFSPLGENITVDVAIIGAGITGLTLALRLSQMGVRVAVLEMRSIGMGATGHTSGHLTAVPDIGFRTLVRRFGKQGATEAITRGMEAIDYIQELVTRNEINCDFLRVDGWKYTEDPKEMAELDAELACAEAAGLHGERQPTGPLPFMAGALRFPNQARFYPLKYLSGLARLARKEGCLIFEDTRVERVVEGTPCTVMTGRYTVTANAVVHASHVPIGLEMPMQARIAPYMTYVIGVRIDGAAPSGLYWDTADPYHYIRSMVRPDGSELVIIGGEDHKTGQEPDTASRFASLESYARARFPVVDVDFRWAWEVFEPSDGLPYIGRLGTHPNVYAATGFAGNGLTFGTAAALDIASRILSEKLPKSVFVPQRYSPVSGAAAFLKENANVAWRMVRDRLQGLEHLQPEDVACGQGKIVEVEGKKAAVYRDPSGRLNLLSATCPHAGGVVQWNDAAHTWDCPLHGSRFLPSGEPMCGPASVRLCPAESLRPAEERSISDLLLDLVEKGYGCDLQPMEGGRVRCSSCDLDAPATAGRIEQYHRFEGMSDPDEMSMVVAMRLPRADGTACKGVLVLTFGPLASPEQNETLANLKFDPHARREPCGRHEDVAVGKMTAPDHR